MSYEDGQVSSVGPAYDRFLESEPLHTALSRIDSALEAEDVSLTLEIAEDTYSWLQTLDPEEDDHSTTKATFYVDKELGYIQEAAPESDFTALPADEENESYDLVYPAITLHFKFGEQHKTSFPVETEYERLNIMSPPLPAYLDQTLEPQ